MNPADGATILLVEDNDGIRGAMAILLEDAGYTVLEAGTGAGAIEMVRERHPDLVLMDLGLPDINGLEVTRRLRSDPATADARVVALTGRALGTDREASIAAGCVGYITKPIDTHQLIEDIARYLREG